MSRFDKGNKEFITRNAGERHRMPWGFGPTTGPRMHIDGAPYDFADAPRCTTTVSFLTEHQFLEPLLPPGFSLAGDSVVTVEFTELSALEWLAGRGYNILGVRFNTRFSGDKDKASGPFLAVLWENMAEPILSGREELGFAKLYCELPPPRQLAGRRLHSASWDGHGFMRMEVSDLRDAMPPPQAPASDELRGTLHYRYLPKVSTPGEADVQQAVLTPQGGVALRQQSFQVGSGEVEFIRSTWEQVPTMHHIINTLAQLPVLEWRGATVSRTRGAKDLSDQRVLR